ncbi:DNA primase large subunit Spp2, partial [Marasmius crinis-equi]
SPLARSQTSSPKPKTQYYDNNDSSSDEEDGPQDELVTGFDRFGVKRLNKPKKAPEGPLVIPALKNKDWRELARKRRTNNQFLPDSARAGQTGADGSVGGLGTRERIGDGAQLSGLQVRKKEVVQVKEEDEGTTEVTMEVDQE